MQRFRPQSLWRPYFVLVVSLALTACAALYVAQAAREQDRLRFENMANRTRDAMGARLRTYITVLRGGAGLINAGNLQRFGSEQVPTAPVSQLLVGRAAFHDYIGKLRLETDFPGIQGVGFSVRVPPNQKNDFLATISRQDAKFRMWPTLKSEAGPDWHSIAYLEPRDERNEAAIGFNMYSEPTRRAAMQKARDTGDAATSGKVLLKQEITAKQASRFSDLCAGLSWHASSR